jgi:DNA-binding MarR family transcriptional regulator
MLERRQHFSYKTHALSNEERKILGLISREGFMKQLTSSKNIAMLKIPKSTVGDIVQRLLDAGFWKRS